MSSLYDFENVESPVIDEIKPYLHPTRKDVILGFIGLCQTRDNPKCMNILRHRYGSSSETQDYYRKVGGYSMPKRTIKRLVKESCGYLFVEEVDNDRLIEYQVAQFPQVGVEVEDHLGEPQWCVPVENAIHTWKRGEFTVNHVKE